MAEPEWADKSDYSPDAWRARVLAARGKVKLDERRGRPTPAWIRELAAEEMPEIPRPTKRRGSAA
jgi:hypothetical protein